MPRRRERHVEGADHVDLEGLAPRVGRGLRGGSGRPERERVVHDDVEPVEGVVRHAHELLHVGVDGHVGRHDHGAVAVALELGRHRVEVLGPAGRERDVRALPSQRPRDRAPEAGSDARDDRGSAVEESHGGSDHTGEP